ncbi:MAG: DUF599 domain-containing protein [Rhodobacterales bacterium]|nr:DUF599 domain-containing protein [Rhodobacterales bacterium]
MTSSLPALPVGILDYLTLAFCLACWVGYTLYSERSSTRRPNMMAAMSLRRRQWMAQMAGRDLRMVDTNILGMTVQAISMFASTSIIIVGGLLAVLGALDEARAVARSLAFVRQAPIQVWEVRILVLAGVFTYAFFKFAWSIRQYNQVAILIGACPPASAEDPDGIAEQAAAVGTLAALSYNRGIRAYYFGLAIPTSFIHPLLLVAATLWVVNILHRREFRSRTLKAVLGKG